MKSVYPDWQINLRMSVEGTTRRAYGQSTEAERQDSINGQRLYSELFNRFGIPIAGKTLTRNCYVIDGYKFWLKDTPDGNEAAEPLFASTQTLTQGTKYNKREAAVSYTLYVAKLVPDSDFDGWPKPKAVVVKNFNLNYGNPRFIRAALMNAIEMLDAEFDEALAKYQLWKVTANMAAADMQDWFMQLIRRAVNQLPGRTIAEYDVLLDAQEAIANVDGMIPTVGTRKADVLVLDPDDEGDDDDDITEDDFDDEDDEDDDSWLDGHQHDDVEPDSVTV